MSIKDIGTIVTTALAVLCLIEKIINNSRRIKLTCGHANQTDENKTVKMLRITVSNHGSPITIDEAGLIMKDNYKFCILETDKDKNPLPKKLTDGDSVSVFLDLGIVLHHIKNRGIYFKSAYVLDSDRKCYKVKLPNDLLEEQAKSA